LVLSITPFAVEEMKAMRKAKIGNKSLSNFSWPTCRKLLSLGAHWQIGDHVREFFQGSNRSVQPLRPHPFPHNEHFFSHNGHFFG
jgi:hypothetical protein